MILESLGIQPANLVTKIVSLNVTEILLLEPSKMLAVKLMSLIATLQSKPTWAAPLQPDNVPSIHPFTGPDPPQVATPPHGSPNQWTPPTTSDRVNSPATHSIGQFWTGWQNIQKIFAL